MLLATPVSASRPVASGPLRGIRGQVGPEHGGEIQVPGLQVIREPLAGGDACT